MTVGYLLYNDEDVGQFSFIDLWYPVGTCNTYSYGVRAIIQCLPAWFRFVQCLRRYRDTKRAFPHLVNAGKYSTTFFVVTFAALYKTHKGKHLSRCQIGWQTLKWLTRLMYQVHMLNLKKW